MPQLYAPYLKKYPGQKPQFKYMTSETNALAQMSQGLKPDIVRPYVGYVRDFAESGFVQPWNTKLIPNLKQLNQDMVKAGRHNGKQYGIPQDWGFDAVLYRTDKVKPKGKVGWNLLWDERYAGKIAWWDDLYMLVVAGYALGMKNPWRQTDAQLERSRDLLADKVKKGIPRMFWSSETDMQNAFAGGDIWIAYAWPADWAAMKAQGAEGRLRASEGGSDLLDRDAHARQGLAAPAARARVRRCLELPPDRQLAHEQLRLRALEPPRPSAVGRARHGAPDQQPERAQGAEHAHRQVHPEPARLREGLARGEGRRLRRTRWHGARAST